MKITLKSLMRFTLLFHVITLLVMTPYTHYSIHSNAADAVLSSSSISNQPAEQKVASWPKGPKVAAKSAIVMEASTGLVLYEKKVNSKHYPASITKIMTTLLAIENCALNETVTFSKNAVYSIEPGSSNIGITAGEKLTIEECLYGIMLESANEVSNAVAEHIAGSTDKFADMMNERAKELGCKNTNFVNAHGLFANDHVTSAYDMALISKAALENKTFRKVTSTKTSKIPPTNLQKATRYLSNHQQMLTGIKYPKFKYEECIGGKTGYTQKARYTLATFAERDGVELICIIMRDDKFEDQYKDTTRLLDYAFDNYSVYNIAKEENSSALEATPFFTRFSPIISDNSTPLKVCDFGNVILPNSASFSDTNREVIFLPKSKVVDNQNVVGKVVYTYGGKEVGYADILYQEANMINLAKIDIPSIIEATKLELEQQKNLKPFIIAIIIIILASLYTAYYFLIERPKSKRRKAAYERHKRTSLSFDNDLLKLK